MNKRLQFAMRIRQRGFFVHFPIKNVEDTEYIRLWRSVLDVYLHDLLRGKDNMTGLTVQDQRDIDIIWKELEEWSDVNNYDFQIVCGFSEFNPSIIKKVIVYCVENAETIEKGQKWNDIIRSTLQSNQSPKDS